MTTKFHEGTRRIVGEGEIGGLGDQDVGIRILGDQEAGGGWAVWAMADRQLIGGENREEWNG